MKASAIMKRAERHRAAMQSALDEIRARLIELLGYAETDVLYQNSDGWVIMFDQDALNAKLTFVEIDKLFCMDGDQAIEFLLSKSI